MDNFYIAKSLNELDDLAESGELYGQKYDFLYASTSSETFSNEINIFYAVNNYIEAERHMTVANHEKAYLCLIRFLKEIKRIVDSGGLGKEEYQQHREIYDYYMSEEVKCRAFEKLALLRDNLHSQYMTMSEMRAQDHHKSVSIPNEICFDTNEFKIKKPNDIFNINKALNDRNCMYSSNRNINSINESFNRRKAMIRKSISIPNGLDMKWDQNYENQSNSNIKHVKRISVSDRVNCMTSGYTHIIAPIIVKQTLHKIEEYKEKIELNSKSNAYIEYKWQKNRQTYMTRALSPQALHD